ncbi:MAG: YbhB/YbcL family Raf kinase inhibitor-like protein [Hydrogenophaga sp.]|nr:YbhB/YbcL family Raf kinase inhibitor-like protein [Hydrogenophaga sp.]
MTHLKNSLRLLRNTFALATALMGALGLLTGAQAQAFEVRSPSLTPDLRLTQAHVFSGFGCEGGNQSPALTWTQPPEGTESLAITVHDPDAPTGSGWWHWVVYNLPPQTTQLPADAGRADGQGLPAGAVQGRTDYGSTGFGGACPPAGDAPHRYRFTVHALKVPRLELPAEASPAMVGYMLHMNRIGSATLEARFGR